MTIIEILPPTSTLGLPPFADAGRYLAIPGTSAPANLDDLLAEASQQIRTYCGWHIAPVIEELVTLDGSGGCSQRLPSLHVRSITSVSSGGTDYDLTADSTSVQWSEAGWLRLPGGWFSADLRGVVVQFVHGYEMADVAELGGICCDLVRQATTSPAGTVASETVGSTSVSYSTSTASVTVAGGSVSLLGYQMAALDRYALAKRAQ